MKMQFHPIHLDIADQIEAETAEAVGKVDGELSDVASDQNIDLTGAGGGASVASMASDESESLWDEADGAITGGAEKEDSLWDQADSKTREATENGFNGSVTNEILVAAAGGESLWEEAEGDLSTDGGAESLWEEGDSNLEAEPDLGSLDSGSPWDFGILLWNKFAHDTQDDYPYESDYYNHIRGIPYLEYRKSDWFYAKVAVQGDYFAYHYNTGWEDDTDFRFHDTFVNFSGSGFNAKIGNQVVRWGKTDGFSPLDNVNPEDYRDGIASRREDRKIPIPMVNLQAYRGAFTIQGLYIPFFIKSEFDITGTDWAWFDRVDKAIGPFQYDDPDYSLSLADSQGGARITATTHGFDLAFSYLNKINDLPSIDSLFVPPGVTLDAGSIRELPRFTQATGQTIQLKYDRTSIWGLEVETTVGDIGVRGDVAYDTNVNFLTDTLESIEKPVFEYTVGFDYNSANNFYINVQFNQAIIQDWEDRILLSKEVTSAVTGTISKEFYNGNFKPEFRIYYDLKGDASIYNPKLLIYYWQNLTIDIGAEFFDGEDWTVIGTFKDNDQVYAIIELNF